MIYLHVPFCESFCIYCDFYSELTCGGKTGAVEETYAESLLREIGARRSEIELSDNPKTLYMGGGTPSVLPLGVLTRLVSALPQGCHSDEFTIEVNPEDIILKGPAYVQGLLDLGVDRVSVGVQSLDDGILKWMRRRHSASEALEALHILRAAGVQNISVDVIFGLSQMSSAALENTLRRLLEFGPSHISAYQLSVEEGSSLGALVRRGQYRLASDDVCAEQYSLICKMLREGGYSHYEISNWALPGYEAVHNSAYWTRKAYVGLGPGAHSFDGSRRRSWNSQQLLGWTSTCETLTVEECREEQIMLPLRTSRGVPATLLNGPKAQQFLREGLLVPVGVGDATDPHCASDITQVRTPDQEELRLRIPEDKFFVSDSIIEELI